VLQTAGIWNEGRSADTDHFMSIPTKVLTAKLHFVSL
jgi:hypothetical protein